MRGRGPLLFCLLAGGGDALTGLLLLAAPRLVLRLLGAAVPGDAGGDLVLVIDVQGARKVRATGFEHVGIFVLPPSFEVLEERLRRRSKDSETQIQQRLMVAQQEVAAVEEYDYVVINDEVDRAVGRLRAIVQAERSTLRVMQPIADSIIDNFRAAQRRT